MCLAPVVPRMTWVCSVSHLLLSVHRTQRSLFCWLVDLKWQSLHCCFSVTSPKSQIRGPRQSHLFFWGPKLLKSKRLKCRSHLGKEQMNWPWAQTELGWIPLHWTLQKNRSLLNLGMLSSSQHERIWLLTGCKTDLSTCGRWAAPLPWCLEWRNPMRCQRYEMYKN